jgi:hypothetical protein
MRTLNLPVAAAALALALLPVSATAGHDRKPARIVGQYFLSDDGLDLAGGAVLYSDCSHDGGVVGAIPTGPVRTVFKLKPTYWVNDPDPFLEPYAEWEVPPVLADIPRLFLCYDVEPISEPAPPFEEFCDWAPRDLKRPLEVDLEGDGVRDLLIGVVFNGGARVCADRRIR